MFFATLGLVAISLNTSNAQLGGNKPSDCSVEVFDCPGWFTGNRQICHANGDGVSCSNCGESTICGGNEQ